MSSAVERSAVPLASVNRASTMRPLRFSIIRCPMWQSLASLPAPLRNKRASGSVVEKCVSFLRFSPWKSRSALRPPLPWSFPDGGSPLSFGTKLFMLAQASIRVPSTEKCSPESSLRTWGRFNTLTKELGRDIAVEQPIPVLAEDRRIPHLIIRREPDEPPEQQIVVELLHQLPLR